MMSVDTKVELRKLSIGYDQPLMKFNEVNFVGGEMVGLIGRNGVGKSTLLRTIGGLIEPIAGDVFSGDKNLRSMSARERAQHFSFVFANRPHNSLRVEETVALGRFPWLGFLGKSNSMDKRIINDAMEKTGVERFRGKPLSQLSDGERQQVMVARALAQSSNVILLDEPTAFLDVANKSRLVKLLRELSDEGKCVLFSTHDLQLALDNCNRVLVVGGPAPWIGTPEELIHSAILHQAFGKGVLQLDTDGNIRYK
jgi:iron complex transport system ATP-binding protein